ncbi:type II toxin-antitoxin system RelE/ParE family toxin [Bifidobacterium sp. 82T24]|nr:type II toxin-antitoxin system RelE/ParE family toxin [Bifidobacterium pluvialisilvae]
MMQWDVKYTKAAKKDIKSLHEPIIGHVFKAIEKVSANPLPVTEGGYGKPPGNKRGNNLTGLMKVKLRGDGIRIVYKLERSEHTMRIIIVSVRDDYTVYNEAAKRIANS